jgi:hypothetical protein
MIIKDNNQLEIEELNKKIEELETINCELEKINEEQLNQIQLKDQEILKLKLTPSDNIIPEENNQPLLEELEEKSRELNSKELKISELNEKLQETNLKLNEKIKFIDELTIKINNLKLNLKEKESQLDIISKKNSDNLDTIEQLNLELKSQGSKTKKKITAFFISNIRFIS